MKITVLVKKKEIEKVISNNIDGSENFRHLSNGDCVMDINIDTLEKVQLGDNYFYNCVNKQKLLTYVISPTIYQNDNMMQIIVQKNKN